MGAESLSSTPETLVARTGVVAVGVVRSGWERWRQSPQDLLPDQMWSM